MWWASLFLAVLAISGRGATKQAASGSGISQFWANDYKVFDQIYGKTSDKEIFGATLPPTIAYGVDANKYNHEASEKKERYIENHQNAYLPLDENQDPYGYGAKYPSLTNHAVINPVKPPKLQTKFIPADFKPIISKNNDPETYEYLKHLELLQKKKEKYLLQNAGGFKPYLNYGSENTEETEAYKSIQDILEAHEANKGNNNDHNDEQVKYLTYGGPKPRGPVKKVKPPTVTISKGKPRCVSGRCRKRATTIYRGRTYLTRPMVRKIKKIIYH
ncbi:hypothetical protein O0L34_g5698 [Tuta absoluta]|nr:hypothetical protein O0L34_g5698 [Tuta absoluta]